MPNDKKKFTCHYPDCDEPATRALTYFVDAPIIASMDPKQEIFCDEHAEGEMLELQTPGLFTLVRWDGTNVHCTVNQLTNVPLENGCCHKRTRPDSLAAMVGADTDFREEL